MAGLLFLLTKRERLAKVQSYGPFTPDDLRAVFEPAGFKTWATAPDLRFPPLVALFSGMRIREATAVGTADVKLADNGVHCIRRRPGYVACRLAMP
ncbi:hypothetical protein WK43_30220 [Burkholderia ubonensis]|uniref:hypothetical protein n=1 Tax=Burkholderia ubonensis TaxID=101571 RepID=UPI000758E84F|nr:hypothetical protein [Burkholderia ubonensis]KVS36124.1 hypothetical protein WK37_32410 [Burkholderia ubonensis]KVS49734.1 hypothetical protein WK38_16550 [Burkholderia ubonensis]KVS72579.1 hypothetical protein WK42_23895 [Burkholderia ubonensis]KVS78995.1 hypothetical protein WK43_30220 [Burkholderia ubonensis]KVS80322.1 hypothetical protein WK44_30215 [Burkholderia ubonensis]